MPLGNNEEHPKPPCVHGSWIATPNVRAGSDYAQVERRRVTFLDQTMSRGEAFGLKKYIKTIHCKILNILMEKKCSASQRKFRSSKMLDPNFAREVELLGAINS
jgi:hypothetical protein